MKLVILDGETIIPQQAWKRYIDDGRVTDVDYYSDTPSCLAVERMRGAQMVLTNKVVISASMMDCLPDLRYIGVLATGYNVVDVKAATSRGITVTNIPSYSTDSVVQMAWAHILNIFNRVDHYAVMNREGRWSRSPLFCYSDFPFHELAGMTIGIVGLGNIGMKMARVALAFGMKVLAMTSKPQSVLPEGVTATALETLLKESDIVSLHCPLTDNTREMIDAETLALMKSSAILINTGRGQLVNENDLADALHDGRIAAYGADVLTVEPALPDNRLVKEKNCFLTPHIAWTSIEARERLIRICMDNIAAFLDGSPSNVVN